MFEHNKHAIHSSMALDYTSFSWQGVAYVCGAIIEKESSLTFAQGIVLYKEAGD